MFSIESCFEIQSTRFIPGPVVNFWPQSQNCVAQISDGNCYANAFCGWLRIMFELILLIIWQSSVFDDHFVSCLTFDFTLTIIQCQMCLSETSRWLWLICLTIDSERSGVLRDWDYKSISTRHGNVYLTAINYYNSEENNTGDIYNRLMQNEKQSQSVSETGSSCARSLKFLPSN